MIDDQHQRLLLDTKLEPPPLPSGVVERPRVVAALDAVAAPYVQLVAGPGYGKSLAARQAVARLGIPSAWVSLDPIDDTPGGFWAYVAESLHRAADVGAEAGEMLADGAPTDAWLTALLRDLADTDAPVALVLDDLHVVRSPEVLSTLALFVERISPAVRVIATSRVDPSLPVARWHLEGRAGEIRQDVLRFSPEETALLVADTDDVELGPDAVATLVERTEGWAAGIQLSLLSLRGRPDADAYLQTAFPPDRMVADYLLSEVLDRLPADDRQLLLDLSILDDFDGPLAAHVTSQPDAGSRVRALEAAGVLVLPVDEDRTRLRFHPLLRDLLRQELRWRQPERISDLHRRAAAYLAEHGHPRQAVQQLISGDMLEDAFAHVSDATLVAFDKGDVRTTRRWLGQFPTPFIAEDVGRMTIYGTLLIAAGEVDAAVAWLDRVDATKHDASPRQVAEVLALRLTAAMGQGEMTRAARTAAELTAQGQPAFTPPLVDRVPSNMTRLALYEDDLDEAARWLEVAQAIDSGDVVMLLPRTLAAELALAHGDLVDAEVRARDALVFAAGRGTDMHTAVGEAHAVVAAALFERGELAEADASNRAAAEIFTTLRVTYLEIRQRVLAARIASARFGPQAGADLLAMSRDALRSRHLGPEARDLLAAAEAEVLVAGGDTGAARAAIATLPPGPTTSLLLARAHKRDGNSAETIAALGDVRTWPFAIRLDGLLLLATCHRGTEAADLIHEAAALGAPRGYVRPFLAPGAELVRLLRAAQRTRPTAELEGILLHADAAEPARAPVATFGTALTEREQALLSLLPTHLTYREMADRLCISVNTVKTNQKALYRKLQVATRSDAVEAGRNAGYITT